MPFDRKIISLTLIALLILNVSFTGLSFIDSNTSSIYHDNSTLKGGTNEEQWSCFGYDRHHTHLSPYDSSHVDGTLKWSYDTGSLIAYSSPSIDKEGNIYIGTSQNDLLSIKPNGGLNWDFNAGDDPSSAIYSTPAIEDNKIYFGSRNGNLYSLFLNGTLDWKFTTDGAVDSSPTISPEGTILIGSGDHKIYAVNPNGTEKWNYSTDGWVRSSATIDDDGTIYVGSYDGDFYSLHPNGTLKWKYSSKDGIFSSPAICDKGNIYVGSWDGNFYSFDKNGSVAWKYDIGYKIFSSPAMGPDGSILVGAHDGKLYSFGTNGTLKWTYSTGSKVSSSPALDSNGNVFFGSEDNYMYGLNCDGELKWRYETGSTITSSPSISEDGTVYIASHDHKLYAFTGSPSAPQDVEAESHPRRVELSWKEPPSDGGNEITEYMIYRNDEAGNLTFLTSVSSSDMEFNDTDVVNNVTYYYQISAKTAYAESERSEIVNATPHNRPPTRPTNLTLEEKDENSYLNWSEPLKDGGCELTNYNIYRGLEEDNLSLITIIDKNRTDYEDESIEKGVRYYYAVTAVNDVGEGESSAVRSINITTEPSPPVNLTAAEDDLNISLDWGSPDDDGGLQIHKYKIYRGVSGSNLSFYDNSSSTHYKDGNIEKGTYYRYYVTAVNDAGESSASNSVNAEVTTITSPPRDLVAVEHQTSISLDWDQPLDDGGLKILNYRVYRGRDMKNITFYAEANSTSFLDTNIEKGVEYYYFVTSVNGLGESDPSGIVSMDVTTKPSVPVNLTADEVGLNISLDWAEPLDDGGTQILYYNVYRGTDEGNMSLYGNVSSTEFIDTDIELGTVYHYCVTAVNGEGESAPTSTVSEEIITKPSPPINLSAVSTNDSIDLSWSPPEIDGGRRIYGYRIYRGKAVNKISLLTEVDSSTDFYSDRSIEKGETYYYYVTALNEVGESDPSNFVNSEVITVPSNPQNLTAVETGLNISLSWEVPSDDGGLYITSYRIYRGRHLDNISLYAEINKTSFLDSDVEKGVEYHYLVTASNRLGESEPSNMASMEVTTEPSCPLNLTAVQDDLNISLDWSAPSDNGGSSILHYNIYRGTSEGNMSYYQNVSSTGYKDMSIDLGTNYLYHVTAVNSVGESDPSNEAHAEVITVPSRPIDLTVSEEGTVSHLGWSEPSSDGGREIDSYNIYRGNNDDNLSIIATVDKNTTDFEDGSVQKGVEYYYSITAVNAVGEGEQSIIKSIMITTIPSSPIELTAQKDENNVSLDWKAPLDDGGLQILKYNVYRGNTEGNISFYTDVSCTEFTDSDIEIGDSYLYYVTAVNDVGESEPSNEVNMTVQKRPSPPLNLDAYQNQDSISLSWSPPEDDGGSPVNKYKIYRGTDTDNLSLLTELDVSKDQYSDPSIDKGTTYYYHITAVNDVGESEPSNKDDAEVTTVPSPPTDLNGKGDKNNISLDWNEPNDDGGLQISNYRIYRGTESGNLSFYDDVGTTNFIDSNVEENSTYYYHVTAVNSLGESDASVTVKVSIITTPSEPKDLRAETGNGNVNLTWNPPSDNGGSEITEYRIYRGQNRNNLVQLTAISGDKTKYVDNSVKNGDEYFYRVSAVNEAGEGPKSNVVKARPSGGQGSTEKVPTAPRKLNAEPGNSTVNLSWEPPANTGGSEIKEYKIYRGKKKNNLTYITSVAGNVTNYSDTSVENENDYFYRVSAVNEAGEGPKSNVVKVRPSWRYAPGMEFIPLLLALILVSAYIKIKKEK